MNTFLSQMTATANLTKTENGGVTHKHTDSQVLDMFALGGAYRNRSDADIILLFKNAFEEDRTLALKCLFYQRDVRGGQGERRFFRVAFKWLCEQYPDIARANLKYLPEYGRYDDLIYATADTKVQLAAFKLIKHQLALDIECKTPSLLAKWMPSINASSSNTQKWGRKLAKFLNMSEQQYRKMLSALRAKICVLEKLMSANRWNEIEFDKIPSKAGLMYKNAFARRDILAKKYEAFIKDNSTKVNADTLYPYEIASKAFSCREGDYHSIERLTLQKYWDNLKDYYCGRRENGIAIVDTSGSMNGRPMEAAVSLGAYIAEKSTGPFANHFITFSAYPQLVKFQGVDIVEKFKRCYNADWGMNTNIQAVFDMLLDTAMKQNVKAEDMPDKLYIFSDMQFDRCVNFAPAAPYDIRETDLRARWEGYRMAPMVKSVDEANTDLEKIAAQWKAAGYELPRVIFWNLNATTNVIPALGKRFSYVSGFSPNMVECILGGKDGYDLMLEKLMSKRYEPIKAV